MTKKRFFSITYLLPFALPCIKGQQLPLRDIALAAPLTLYIVLPEIGLITYPVIAALPLLLITVGRLDGFLFLLPQGRGAFSSGGGPCWYNNIAFHQRPRARLVARPCAFLPVAALPLPLQLLQRARPRGGSRR